MMPRRIVSPSALTTIVSATVIEESRLIVMSLWKSRSRSSARAVERKARPARASAPNNVRQIFMPVIPITRGVTIRGRRRRLRRRRRTRRPTIRTSRTIRTRTPIPNPDATRR